MISATLFKRGSSVFLFNILDFITICFTLEQGVSKFHLPPSFLEAEEKHHGNEGVLCSLGEMQLSVSVHAACQCSCLLAELFRDLLELWELCGVLSVVCV